MSDSDLTLHDIKKSHTKASNMSSQNKPQSQISLLLARLTGRHRTPSLQYPPPRPPLLPDYQWSWDPAWRELFVYAPRKSCYLYIARYKHDAGELLHFSMAGREEFTEQKARKVMLDWKNWRIDASGKWFMDLYEEGQSYVITAAYWEAREGRWYLVERW